jgi:hypothetical protein
MEFRDRVIRHEDIGVGGIKTVVEGSDLVEPLEIRVSSFSPGVTWSFTTLAVVDPSIWTQLVTGLHLQWR